MEQPAVLGAMILPGPHLVPQGSTTAFLITKHIGVQWRAIRGAGPDDDSRAAAFRQHWSLKEVSTVINCTSRHACA